MGLGLFLCTDLCVCCDARGTGAVEPDVWSVPAQASSLTHLQLCWTSPVCTLFVTMLQWYGRRELDFVCI